MGWDHRVHFRDSLMWEGVLLASIIPSLTTFVKTKIILPLNFPKHSKDSCHMSLERLMSQKDSRHMSLESSFLHNIKTFGRLSRSHFLRLLERILRPREKCWTQGPSANQGWARTRTGAPAAQDRIPPTASGPHSWAPGGVTLVVSTHLKQP